MGSDDTDRALAAKREPAARPRSATTISRRIQRSYLTVTAFTLLILQVPLGWMFARGDFQDLAATALTTANALSDLLEIPLVRGDEEAIATFTRAYVDNIGGSIAIFDAQGNTLAEALVADHPTSLAEHPDVAMALQGITVSSPSEFERGPGWLSVAVPVFAHGEVVGAIDIIMPTAEVERRVWLVGISLTILALSVLGIVAVLGGRLSAWAVTPLSRLEDAARRWREGDLATRSQITDGPAELQRLGATFDEMAERLESSTEARESFLAHASHQLRLPLTAHRLRLANLEPHLVKGARRQLRELEQDVADFGDRLDQLLLLVHAESRPGIRSLVDVEDVAGARRDFWAPVACRRGIELSLEPSRSGGSATVEEFPGAVEQILDNLLANALSATDEGGTVTIRVVTGPDDVELHVVDDGPGMTPAERERAFEAFWRHPTARGHGSGLGLGIVRRLAVAMGADIVLRDGEADGLDAVLVAARIETDIEDEVDRRRTVRGPAPASDEPRARTGRSAGRTQDTTIDVSINP